MKVCLLTGSYPPNRDGIADYSQRLARSLVTRGVEVAVLTTALETIESDPYGQPAVVKVAPQWDWQALDTVRRLIAEHDPDVVHIQYPSPVGYGRHLMINFLPAILRATTRVRIITTVHEFSEQRTRWRFRVIPNLLFSHRLIMVNEADLETAEEFLASLRAKTTLIPIATNIDPVSGVNRAAVRAGLGVADDELLLFHFGVPRPDKGLETLLAAFDQLVAKGERVRLLVVASAQAGDYHEQYQRDILGQVAARPRAIIRDSCPEGELSGYLQAADVAAFPFANGVGAHRGSILVALVHGLPVVTTQGENTPLIWQNGHNALLTPPGDAKAFASAVTGLIHLPELRRSLGDAGAALGRVHTWDGIADATLELYNELVGEPVPALAGSVQ
ncbi:MAG: glycosyltransferase family 4 protein [Chloroflexi bacterium]|nr:glycosyltransferase family 4 protein [Chloroflexota bacterium]